MYPDGQVQTGHPVDDGVEVVVSDGMISEIEGRFDRIESIKELSADNSSSVSVSSLLELLLPPDTALPVPVATALPPVD